MEMNQIQLYIRQELFDHLVYPISLKLEDNVIIFIFRKLHVISDIDFKISYKDWISRSTEAGLSEKEADILFQTYKIFESETNEYNNSNSNINSRYEAQNNKNRVDLRYFGLFFVLQTYTQRLKISLNIDKSNEKSPFNYMASPLSSPRGKCSNSYRNQKPEFEYQFLLSYIKANLKLFLRIIASDIHNSETTLNANECNTLKFLFKIYENNEIINNNCNKAKKSNLSNYASFFDNLSSVEKISMNIVYDWLISKISTTLPENSDYINIHNLSKCVTIKYEECQNKNIKISQCTDSYIYINTNVINCKISHCENTTIFIGAVNKITSIDKCDKCTVCVISNFVRISNMTDSYIYLYAVYSPILYGDNRGLYLGPYNISFGDLYTHIKNSKLNLNHQGINNFAKPNFLNEEKNNNFNIIQPQDFKSIVLPFESKETHNFNYKITPKNYVDAIELRNNNYYKLMNKIKEANFTEEQEKGFHLALQGYFREWIVTSGNYKPMNDIVKMIGNPTKYDELEEENNNDSDN